MTKTMYFSQEVLGETELFGKFYYWMRDINEHIYLVKMGENGQPDLS